MERLCRIALVATTLALSWLGMMAVHEFGHVLNAYLSGGRVSRLVLDPSDISHTELSANPHPMFVAWGGVVWGTAIPATLLLLARAGRSELRHLASFFGGFCLVANGAYLVAGVATRAGDPGDLLRLGASRGSVLAAGLLASILGLALWHRLGSGFGFPVHRAPGIYGTTAALLALLCVCVVLELAALPR